MGIGRGSGFRTSPRTCALMLGALFPKQMIKFSIGQILVTSVIMGALKKQGAITYVTLASDVCLYVTELS